MNPTISLITPTPQFANDLADVVRIFWGGAQFKVNEPGGEITVTHTETEANGVRFCRVEMSGACSGCAEKSKEISPDALLEKRYHKRLIKQALYDVMKQVTGRTPPWGSLTGIRPTRLLYEGMSRGLTLQQAEAETREIFDLLPEKAALLREIIEVQQALPIPQDDEVDLYVGIPFCVSRCAYCSFLSGEVGKGKQLPPYVDALKKEITGTLALIEEKGLKPRAFYMGGGTPTSLSAAMLDRVLTAVQPFIDRAMEVTVEAGRPDTIDAEKLAVIRSHKATRISINPQTMDDRVLAIMGRSHSSSDILRAYEQAIQAGHRDINMDLIAGLPGDTPEGFHRTLDQVLALSPASITVHTLALKKAATLYYENKAVLPSADDVEQMLQAGNSALRRENYRSYYLYRQKYMTGSFENVGWCRHGFENLYNIYMMEEMHSILSLGAGGMTKIVSGGKISRISNPKYPQEYIRDIQSIMTRKREVSL